MNKIVTSVLCFAFLLIVVAPSHGSQLNPCYRILTYMNNSPGQKPIRPLGRGCGIPLKHHQLLAVHEHMTAASIRAYRMSESVVSTSSNWTLDYTHEQAWRKKGRSHRTLPIILGNWWNDDPLMLTWGQGYPFMHGGLMIGKVFNKNRDTFPVDGNCEALPKRKHLAWQSHLGALQHLHFMTVEDTSKETLAEERVSATLESALVWMSFAYQVATGKISPDELLTLEMEQQLKLPPIAPNHCVMVPANVKVRTLFASLQRGIAERNERTPDVALGSMLHVLQDSFSPSHTCRVSQWVAGKEHAALLDVENYAQQDHDKHAALDGHPQWMLEYLESGTHIYTNDPVTVGAWLISAVDQDLPWPEVESHLRNTVFSRAQTETESPRRKCIGRPAGLEDLHIAMRQ